jgi:uncharacterized protein
MVPAAVLRLAEFVAIFVGASFASHVLVQSVSPERLRGALAGRPWRSAATALVLGAVTPFCSCSTVPVVAGMVAAGVPVVATTAFLVVSPLVNPATVALIAALTTPWYAVGFIVVSLVVAAIVALAVTALRVAPVAALGVPPAVARRVSLPWWPRLVASGAAALRDLRQVAPVLLAVTALGALLYGRVDAGMIGRVLDAAGPFAVPLAVLVGVPVYASTALLLPLGAALLASGANVGVVSAFLIGATGLSLPEGVLLHRLMGGRYLLALATAFVLATVVLGYTVQALAPAVLRPGWPP